MAGNYSGMVGYEAAAILKVRDWLFRTSRLYNYLIEVRGFHCSGILLLSLF